MKKHIAVILSFVLIFNLFASFQIFANESELEVVGYDFTDFETGKAPDFSYHNEGTKLTIEEFPSKDSKSLVVMPQKGATQFFIDLPVSTGSNELTLETSIAYKGTLSSSKNIFTISGSNSAYLIFMKLSPQGVLTLYDGTLLATLTEGVFCDITLIINFEQGVCTAKIDGKTQVLDLPFTGTGGVLKDAAKSRIQMLSITSDTEKFYMNYYYAKGIGNSSEDSVEKIEVNKTTVKRRMKDHVLMTTNSSKALVDNKVKNIDSSNPDVAPTIKNSRTMVPLRFISEAFKAKVKYDEATNQATITLDNKEIVVTQNSDKYLVNGEERFFDVAPCNIGGRILVPLRAISETLDKGVFYDKCGYILIGDDAINYDLDNPYDKETLDLAVRDIIFDSPTSEEVTALIKQNNPNNDHPRLLMRKDDLPALREKVKNDPVTASYMQDVIKAADEALTLDPLPYGRVDGPRMLQTNRKAVDRIEAMGFAYLITGDEKYARGCIDVLMNVCTDTFPDWNPYHFLDVGELSAGVALGYDWCYDVMTEEERKIVEEAIYNKSLKEIMKDLNFETTSEERTFKWNSSASSAYPQNWVSVCVGGCSMAALVIGDKNEEYGKIAGEVISKGIEHVKDLLARFAPDGSWYEGPNYWLLAYEFFALGFTSYKTALGTDFGLTNAIGFENGGSFVIGASAPVGVFNLSVCAPYLNNCPEIYYLANEFNNSTYTAWCRTFKEKKGFEGDYRDILWYRPDLDTSSTEGLTLDGVWRGFTVGSARTGLTDSDLYVGFHAADSVGNLHMDSGTFILDMFGIRWAYELGYDPLDYSNGIRTNRYRARAEGHNTMIFNPQYDKDINTSANCSVDRFEYNSQNTILVSDLSDVHKGMGVKSRIRGIMVDKVTKQTIIQDEFETEYPSEMYHFIHTPGEIELSSDGKSAILTKAGKKFYVEILGDNDFTFEKTRAVPLPTSPDVEMISDEQIWKLVIHKNDVTKGTISVMMAPLAGDETSVKSAYEVTPISSWQLKEEKELPTLSKITIGGREIKLNDGQTVYYELYDLYNSEGLGFNIEAQGDGDIKITQLSDDNNVAKITITKDGLVNTYYLDLTSVGVNEIDFAAFTSKNKVSTMKGLTEVEIVNAYSSYVPQEANPPLSTIDGDFNTRFSTDLLGGFIEFDLGSVKNISHVGVAFSVGDKRSTLFRIATSEDGKVWREKLNVFSPDDTLEEVAYDIGSTNARYVRLIGYGNTQNSNWFSPTEVSVYSK